MVAGAAFTGMNFAQVKSLFFDRVGVQRKLDKVTRAKLNKFGARTRLTARSSIRNAPKKDKRPRPGKPPRNRTGRLKTSIFYAFDPAAESVVIGPLDFGSGRRVTVPRLLEEGGRNDKGHSYSQFPFMQPAFELNIAKVNELFKDILK